MSQPVDLASSMPSTITNSSFLLLQQHAAAHQQQQGTSSDGSSAAVAQQSANVSTSVATSTETTTKTQTTAISIMAGGTHHHHSHGTAQSIQRASTAAASAAVINCSPPTVDHCNRPEGFHDGLSDLANDTEEDFVVDSSELEKLEHCASQSRMPPDALTEDEKAAFPDIAEKEDRLHVYLHIRNSILRIWYHNPRKQLLLEDVVQHMEAPLRSDITLLRRIYAFLQRHAYINFGIFQISHQEHPTMAGTGKRPKVIVLGAGIAGLTAARQLQFFGFEVFILESRNRIGGRVCTYKQGEYIADVGSTVICGLGGNPLRVLEKQIPMKLKRIGQKCNLYLNNELIDRSKDEVMETLFNNILEGTVLLSHRMNFNQIGNKSVSLGEAIDVVIELQEREVKGKYLKHLMDINSLEKRLSEQLSELKETREAMVKLYEKYKEYSQSRTSRSVNQEYASRVNRLQLSQALARAAKTEVNVKRLEERIAELEAAEVPRQYLNTEDQRVLDWHFANLEFATAACLKHLSVQHWDQDDDYQFTGPQIAIKNGYACIPYSLADGLDVRLNMAVREVKLLPKGVQVTAVNVGEHFNNTFDRTALAKQIEDGAVSTFVADAVLCTLPLGVLKNSVGESPTTMTPTEDNKTPTAVSAGAGKRQAKSKAAAASSASTAGTPLQCPNRIEFSPPLPDYKVGAIKRLGYGILNKVVLIFDSVFWEPKDHLFGHVASTTETRGELFLFWSIYQQPILMALIAGESATALEGASDETVRTKVMSILAGIFKGAFARASLLNYHVTRWAADPWSLGSYSFVASDSSGDDYDLLAVPVSPETLTAEGGLPSGETARLFFAGEHTIRQYPATVHGALLSGTREATRIANQFLSCPYAPLE